MFRNALGVSVGNAIAFVRITIAPVPGIGHALEVASPPSIGPLELRHEVVAHDGLPQEPIRIFAADAEEVAAGHGNVIGSLESAIYTVGTRGAG